MDSRQQVDTSFWVIADDHFPHADKNILTSKAIQLPTHTAFFTVKSDVPTTTVLHLFDPGISNNKLSETIGFRSEICEEPDFLGRVDWCAQGCGKDLTPQPTMPTHFIIHHSAGTNVSNDWPAVVREIWNLHVNINKWDDIGYNWLIDPNGAIYLGRGDGLQGAHFCGTNQGTVGICLLGEFTDQAPTEQAINSLKELLAWLLYREALDPLASPLHESSGLNLRTISGHRDGCATACPGNQFYPLLDDIAIDLQQILENVCPLTTSLSPNKNLNAAPIIIYPNPVHSLLHIKVPSHVINQFPIQLQVKNVAGHSFYKHQINQRHSPEQIEINISDLRNGLYWLEFITPKGHQRISFVKH